MAEHSTIEWTDATWNPITGCSIKSPGCTHCYAMKLAGTRLQHHPSRAGLTKHSKAGPVWTGEVRFNEGWLTQPLHWKRPRMVFVCAHGDLFHEDVPDEWIDRIFAVMALCPQHTFQVLTKRAERMRVYCSDPQTPFRVARAMDEIAARRDAGLEEVRPIAGYPGYFASSHGFIYSERRGKRRRMSPDVGEQGHQRVQLHRDDGPKRGDRLLVHRIILETFIGLPPNADAQGRHRDGVPTNNAVSNLSWGGQDENWSDAKRHGTHRRYSKLAEGQATEIRRRHAAGETGEALAREYGVSATQIRNIASGRQWAVETPIEWPLPNCWKGVSAERQQEADERIPELLITPASVRLVSLEPLLGPITLGADTEIGFLSYLRRHNIMDDTPTNALDWIIVGGESGDGARPMHPDWVRSIRDQCAAANVPFFFKQWGAFCPGDHLTLDDAWTEHLFDDDTVVCRVGKKRAGRLLDGVEHNGMPR